MSTRRGHALVLFLLLARRRLGFRRLNKSRRGRYGDNMLWHGLLSPVAEGTHTAAIKTMTRHRWGREGEGEEAYAVSCRSPCSEAREGGWCVVVLHCCSQALAGVQRREQRDGVHCGSCAVLVRRTQSAEQMEDTHCGSRCSRTSRIGRWWAER